MNNIAFSALRTWFTAPSFYSSSLLNSYKKLQKAGEKKSILIFKEAAHRIPAYKDFLRKHSVRPDSINSIEEFSSVPVTTKKNYIEHYPVEDRVWDGRMSAMNMISISSGSSGKPHIWPRTLITDLDGARGHELLLNEIFSVSQKSTVIINSFAMGNWIAGTFTQIAVELHAWKGSPITLMTPGYNLEAVLEAIQNVSNLYDQIIIAGHTPFLKEIVDEIVARNIYIRQDSLRFLGAGQGITESWREYLGKRANAHDILHSFMNIYGSADASLMGHETPLTILLRRTIFDEGLQKKIFDDERIPSLYQFDPRLTYIEEVGHELVITKNSGSPLIRYNIQDEGGVRSPSDFISLFSSTVKDSISEKNIPVWQMPFVYLFGRTKFMVKIYGANIYTEHVQHIVDNSRIAHVLTGRFLLDTSEDIQKNPVLILRLEATLGSRVSDSIRRRILQVFLQELPKLNSEYKFLLAQLGSKVHPKVEIYEHGHQKYFPKGIVKKTS